MVDKRQTRIEQIRRAVALHYDPATRQAPSIAASGKGWLAERIITMARDNRIPVVEDKALVKILGNLPVGEEVPQELYEAVAAIYAFIMEADSRKGR